MLHIPDVHLNAPVPLDVFSAVDLRPPGNARPHIEHMPLRVCILLNGPGVIGERGPWPDQAHVAPQNVDQLRQLVKAGRPKHFPHFCHAVIPCPGIDAGASMLGAHLHRAELEHLKFFPVKAEALLPEQRRARGIEPHQKGDHGHRHGGKKKRRHGDSKIDHALDPISVCGVCRRCCFLLSFHASSPAASSALRSASAAGCSPAISGW